MESNPTSSTAHHQYLSNMDSLLEKLKTNIVELSIQGEDFSRQFCHLYETFEDFVDGQSQIHKQQHPQKTTKKKVTKSHQSKVNKCPSSPSVVRPPHASSKDGVLLEDTVMAYSPPITKKEKIIYRRRKSSMPAATPDMYSSNPLLDTISSLTSSDRYESEDDEYHDFPTVCKKLATERKISDECAGYAGSNSIDSGYKSSCPTPELSDSQSFYTDHRSNLGSAPKSFFKEGSMTLGSRSVRKKKKRNDSGFYDINLDHLMYLRQSLISAIDASSTKAKTQPSSSATTVVCTNAEVSCDRTTSLQRFVETNATTATGSASGPRSRKSSSGAACEDSVEDSLCSQAEYYDLESVEDFPCSYVTSSDKNSPPKRTSRLATVKKLKGQQEPSNVKNEKPKEQTPVVVSVAPCQQTSATKKVLEDQKKPVEPTTESGPKRKFTEVAKCMLEIIDDFQKLKLKFPAAPSLQSVAMQMGRQRQSANQYIDDPLIGNSSCRNRNSNRPASEYHVYEEIIYDAMTSSDVPKSSRFREVPPPLPARPNGLKNNTMKKSNNEPKQRRNLYSLFTEQSDRRCISRTLKRESFDDGNDESDEYGFKSNPSASM